MWVICNNTSPSIPVGAQHIPEEWRQPAADVIWQAQSLVLHFPDLRLLESCPFTATASFCQTSAGRETCPVLWALCLQRSVHTLNRLSEQFGKEWKYGVKPGGKTTKKSYIFNSPDMCLPLLSLSLEIWMRPSGPFIKTGIRGSSLSLSPRLRLMPWSIFVLIPRYHAASYMVHGSPVVIYKWCKCENFMMYWLNTWSAEVYAASSFQRTRGGTRDSPGLPGEAAL